MLRFSACALWIASIASGANFQAGAAKREITPPPGYPTGGHGPAGDLARGYWSRLWTRAFFLGVSGAGAKTSGVILVSSDLFATPLGLHAAVWRRIEKEAGKRGLGPESLVLAATHTHHGPGNFLTAEVYNQFGSAYPGFGKELFDFLARRTADAVLAAMQSASPAVLQLDSGMATPDFAQQFISNRSPAVFLLNWDRKGALAALNPETARADEAACRAARNQAGAGEPAEGWDLDGCPRLRAVDRRMTVIEARTSAGNRVGALVFFAVHPTDLTHGAPLYNSDFVGQALDGLEQEWPVAMFFNGGEGDVTARRVFRDVGEVRETSGRFEAAVRATMERGAKEALEPSVAAKARLIDTRRKEDRRCGGAALADQPAFGAAALGGAELDRTVLYDLGWREGVHDRAVKRQGPKVKALDSKILRDIQITSTVAPPGAFPRYLPISYIEIGRLLLGTLPVEVSTTTALRIRQRFEQDGRRYFQLIGLANDYSSYTATEAEYAEQDYMGASTIWGPKEGAFFDCRLAELSQPGRQPPPFHVPGNATRPGPPPRKAGVGWAILSVIPGLKGLAKQPFGPSFAGEALELPDDGYAEILGGARGKPERHLPFFEWEEEIDGAQAEFDAAQVRRVEARFAEGGVADGADAGFLKVLRQAPAPSSPKRRWAAIWISPLLPAPPDASRRYQFHITARAAGGGCKAIDSVPFEIRLDDPGKPAAIARLSETSAPCAVALSSGPR
jgi:neutral ceramidase